MRIGHLRPPVLAAWGAGLDSTAARAGAKTWTAPLFTRPWRLPARAFGEAAGPN